MSPFIASPLLPLASAYPPRPPVLPASFVSPVISPVIAPAVKLPTPQPEPLTLAHSLSAALPASALGVSQKLKSGYTLASSAGLAVALGLLPGKAGVGGGFITLDPRQWAKMGLGIVSVNSLNTLMGWKPPTWGLALETAALMQVLFQLPTMKWHSAPALLGSVGKMAAHFSFMAPILLASVALNQGVSGWVDKVFAKKQPLQDNSFNQSNSRWPGVAKLGVKIAVAGATVAGSLFAYPRLWSLAGGLRLGGFHPYKALFGGPAAKEVTEMLAKRLNTKEATAFLAGEVSFSKEMAAMLAHHQQDVKGLQALLPQLKYQQWLEHLKTVPASAPLKAEQLKGWVPSHALTPVLEKVEAALNQLSHTVENNGVKRNMERLLEAAQVWDPAVENHALLKTPGFWRKLLVEEPRSLNRQLIHALSHNPLPKEQVPFYGSLFASSGATAVTCANGCCAGSVLCLADVADMLVALWNTLAGKPLPQHTAHAHESNDLQAH